MNGGKKKWSQVLRGGHKPKLSISGSQAAESGMLHLSFQGKYTQNQPLLLQCYQGSLRQQENTIKVLQCHVQPESHRNDTNSGFCY